jgi:hypothetical protein
VPLVEITSGELGASLASETVPVTLPAEVGANTTLKVLIWPGPMLRGRVRPDVPNPAPATLALEIVTLAVPPFCSVMVCELLVPVVTPGKLALNGVAESCGVEGGGVGGGVGRGGVVLGGCVVGGGVLPPLAELFEPMTTPAHPLPSIDAASTRTVRDFDFSRTPDR